MAETTSSREDDLHVYQKGRHGDPLNAEPKLDNLVSEYITPISQLFHRNHDDIVYEPKVQQQYNEWKIGLAVDKDVAREQRLLHWQEQNNVIFTVKELIASTGPCKGLEHLNTTATIECAGNRREELAERKDEKAEGIQWGPGVIANVYWSGASIRSLLLLNGIVDPYGHHTDFNSLTPSDENISKDCAKWAQLLHLHLLSVQPTSESKRPEGQFFGASIPLSTAMHPNQRCILAYQHNGKTLEQAHGFPVRAVIPGHAGARWVKWLSGLRISKNENDSPPMQQDYKILKPPNEASTDVKKEWKSKLMGNDKDENFRENELDDQKSMQRLGMGSAIESPKVNENIKGSFLDIRGYAVGQDGSPASFVQYAILEQESDTESSSSLRNRAESSSDWRRAETQIESRGVNNTNEEKDYSWAWTLWSTKVKIADLPILDPNKRYAIVARATTASGIQQEKESAWNIRGFQTRSWPVIRGLQFSH